MALACAVVAATALSGCLFPPVTMAGSPGGDTLGGLPGGGLVYHLDSKTRAENGTFDSSAYVDNGEGENVLEAFRPQKLDFELPRDLRRVHVRLDWLDTCQQTPLNPPDPPDPLTDPPECPADQSTGSSHDLDFRATLDTVPETENATSERLWDERNVRGGADTTPPSPPDRGATLETEDAGAIQRPLPSLLTVRVWAETSASINYTVTIQYDHLVPLDRSR